MDSCSIDCQTLGIVPGGGSRKFIHFYYYSLIQKCTNIYHIVNYRISQFPRWRTEGLYLSENHIYKILFFFETVSNTYGSVLIATSFQFGKSFMTYRGFASEKENQGFSHVAKTLEGNAIMWLMSKFLERKKLLEPLLVINPSPAVSEKKRVCFEKRQQRGRPKKVVPFVRTSACSSRATVDLQLLSIKRLHT